MGPSNMLPLTNHAEWPFLARDDADLEDRATRPLQTALQVSEMWA